VISIVYLLRLFGFLFFGFLLCFEPSLQLAIIHKENNTFTKLFKINVSNENEKLNLLLANLFFATGVRHLTTRKEALLCAEFCPLIGRQLVKPPKRTRSSCKNHPRKHARDSLKIVKAAHLSAVRLSPIVT